MSRLIGHDSLLEELELRKQNNKWPQSILFYGKEGIGKDKLVWYLAQKQLCEHQNACGECRSCRQVLSQQHPDLFLITPPEKKSLIPIDLVRQMEQWESVQSVVKRGKVVLITPAEALTEEAQNALLKVLEEPSQEVYFYLVANQQDNVLPTISTRCFNMKMKPLSIEHLRDVALNSAWPQPSDIDLQLAQGSAGKLYLLLKLQFNDFVTKLIENLSHANMIDVVPLVQGMMDFYHELEVDENLLRSFKERDFVQWVIDLLKLMFEDAARIAEDYAPKYFVDSHFRNFSLLMRRTSRDHRLQFSREIGEFEKDLHLNLPPISVLESVFIQFFQNRFVQK